MNKRKKVTLIIVSVLVLLLGLSLTLYPVISSRYNEQHKAEIKTEFDAALDAATNEEINAAREAAKAYNEKLYRGELSVLTPGENGYYDLVDIAGTGIMGYVRIPTINIDLPIYHGIGTQALSIGVGHMPQTSLPIGGVNTHAVLSAHTGMASDPLFTELESMEVGDYFYIDILNETLTYQVDEIRIVLPNEVSHIQMEKGQDWVTLITCTPYGINSHRLLVRGTRIIIEETDEPTIDTPDENTHKISAYTLNYIKGIVLGVVAGILTLILFVFIRKKKEKKEQPTAAKRAHATSQEPIITEDKLTTTEENTT